jgi:hypothetical protein
VVAKEGKPLLPRNNPGPGGWLYALTAAAVISRRKNIIIFLVKTTFGTEINVLL